MYRGFGFQNILLRFDQQQVHAALNQADGLFAEDIDQFFEGDVAQRGISGAGQHAARSDGTRHEAGQTGVARNPIGGATSHRGRGLIDLDDAILQAIFAHRDPVRSKRIGLDRFRARFKK